MTFDLADFRLYMESSQNTAHIAGVLAEVRSQMHPSNFLYPLKNLQTLNERTNIYTDTNGNSTLLFNEGVSESEGIEAIFVVQGVLWDFALPPVIAKTDIPRRIQFAKQSIVLHGWANKHFAEDQQAIQAVHQKISANYKEGSLKGCDVPNASDSDLTSREYSNRYFTPIQYAEGEHNISFPPVVDPHGHLSRAATTSMVHLPSNSVAYYQYTPLYRRKSETDNSFITFNPAQFRIGQIVQAQIAFKTVPVGGQNRQHRLICQLKSIAMLNNEMQQAYASIVRVRNECQKPSRGLSIKRPVGYFQSTLSTEETPTKKGRVSDVHPNEQDVSMTSSTEGEIGAEGQNQSGGLNIEGLNLNDHTS